MSDYAATLSGPLRTPVVDMTGLTGRYDFEVNLEPYLPGGSDPQQEMVDVVRAAFRDQLGLKLDSRKLPMEIIVIDRAERVPTEN